MVDDNIEGDRDWGGLHHALTLAILTPQTCIGIILRFKPRAGYTMCVVLALLSCHFPETQQGLVSPSIHAGIHTTQQYYPLALKQIN